MVNLCLGCNSVHVPPVVVLHHGFEVPARRKRTESFTEALIINSPSIDGEQPHEKDQISPTKQHTPNLEESVKFCTNLKCIQESDRDREHRQIHYCSKVLGNDYFKKYFIQKEYILTLIKSKGISKTILQKISISNKCSSFELYIHQRTPEKIRTGASQ